MAALFNRISLVAWARRYRSVACFSEGSSGSRPYSASTAVKSSGSGSIGILSIFTRSLVLRLNAVCTPLQVR